MPTALFLLLKVKTSCFFCGSVMEKLIVIELSAFCRGADSTVFTVEGKNFLFFLWFCCGELLADKKFRESVGSSRTTSQGRRAGRPLCLVRFTLFVGQHAVSPHRTEGGPGGTSLFPLGAVGTPTYGEKTIIVRNSVYCETLQSAL